VRAIADWYGKSVATVRRCPPEIRLMPTPQPMPGRRTASPTGQIAAGSRSSGDSVPNTNRDGDGRARRRTRLVLLRFGTKWLLWDRSGRQDRAERRTRGVALRVNVFGAARWTRLLGS